MNKLIHIESDEDKILRLEQEKETLNNSNIYLCTQLDFANLRLKKRDNRLESWKIIAVCGIILLIILGLMANSDMESVRAEKYKVEQLYKDTVDSLNSVIIQHELAVIEELYPSDYTIISDTIYILNDGDYEFNREKIERVGKLN